jgi:hypothetical protein
MPGSLAVCTALAFPSKMGQILVSQRVGDD